MASVGGFTGAIMMGFLLRHLRTKHLMLTCLSACIVGGMLYSIGKFGWMLLLGQYILYGTSTYIVTLYKAYIIL